MSAHAAMIEAGFRKKTFTVSSDPEQAAQTIKRNFKGDALKAFMKVMASDS
jgi:hypothetical protein